MAKDILTDPQIRNAKPTAKERLLADGKGLFLRVRPSGAKDWLFVYTFSGKRRKLGFGSFGEVTLATARKEAAKAHDDLAQQIDPQLSRKERELEQEEKRQALEADKARMTVKELFEKWERRGLSGRKDAGVEVRRSFEKDVLPVLGDLFAEDVKRGMIADCLDNVVERGAPIIARNLLGDLRQMYGYAIKRGYVENEPTSHLRRDDFGKKVERDRVLDDAEIKMLGKKLAGADMQEASIAAVWVMLSTCCRVGEISQARWEHVDLEAGAWWMPPANTKNAKEHTVVLSEFAKVHFQTLRRLVEEAAHDKNGKKIAEPSPWVMPASRQGSGHVCLKSLAKQIGDRQRGDKVPMKNRTKLTQSLEMPKGKWTPHDLRRTGATLMGKLGTRPDVIEKCLNHVEQNRLIRIYQRQALEAEQAEAWRLLGDRLALLTRADAGNVVVMGRNAA